MTVTLSISVSVSLCLSLSLSVSLFTPDGKRLAQSLIDDDSLSLWLPVCKGFLVGW